MTESLAFASPVSRLRAFSLYVRSHVITSLVIGVVVIGVLYGGYKAFAHGTTSTRYVVDTVSTGTVIQTVSGTGQVSASNQVSLVPKTSGQITSILVTPGQHVRTGQTIASVDLGTAGTDLQTAKLQLAQAETTNTNDQTSSVESASKAQSDLQSAHDSGINTLVSSYGSLDQVMVDLDSLYSSSGYLRANVGDATLRTDQNAGSDAYYDAKQDLLSAEAATASITRSSTDDQVQDALTTAYTAAKSVAHAASLSQTAIQYARTEKDANLSGTAAATAWTTITGDVSSSNNQVTSLLSATQAITTAQNAISDAETKTVDVTSGSGALDIRSAELNVQAKQQAYNDHFVTAPFDGTIAAVAGTVGSQASSGSAVATLVTNQELASITLNEVDVAKVSVGQKATLTFDAIDGLSISGTVAEVDGIGTVTQGVVSYGVKIALDTQDARIKPGMTVNADIQVAIAQDTLTIPSAAIKTSNGESYVQVFSPALATTTADARTGIPSATPPQNVTVETGITDGTHTQITSGLTAGEQIVTKTTTGTTAAKSTATSATSRIGGTSGAARATGGFGGPGL